METTYKKISDNEIEKTEIKTETIKNIYDYGFLLKQKEAIQKQRDEQMAQRDLELAEVEKLIVEAEKFGIIEKVGSGTITLA